MNHTDLVKNLQTQLPFSDKQAEKVIINILKLFTQALCSKITVRERGFGNFTIRQRKPKTGAQIEVPAKHYIHFKPGKELRDVVNHGYNEQI